MVLALSSRYVLTVFVTHTNMLSLLQERSPTVLPPLVVFTWTPKYSPIRVQRRHLQLQHLA